MLLMILAGTAIVIRYAWVADIVLLVEKEKRQQDRSPQTQAPSTRYNDDLPGGSNSKPLDQWSIITFAIQVTAPSRSQLKLIAHICSFLFLLFSLLFASIQALIIATLAAFIWVSCVIRAVRFREAVQSYGGDRRCFKCAFNRLNPTSSLSHPASSALWLWDR